jgi:hypothetical protein
MSINNYNKYKPTDKEREFVGKLTNIEPNDISYKFFSGANLDYINNQLIERVKIITLERYGKKIGIEPQRKHIVLSIMRHVYFKNIRNMFETNVEVDLLNEEVLRQMVPMVIKELISYMRFIHDYNNIIPMELPVSDNKKKDNVGSFSRLFE